MSELDHLVPSSPWPSRRALRQFAVRGTVVVASFAVLTAGVRAIPRETIERLVNRRPDLVPAAGTWPAAPVQVRSLTVVPLGLDRARLEAIAVAAGLPAPASFTEHASTWRYQTGDGALLAHRDGDLWVVSVSRPAREAAPAERGREEQVARRLIAAAGLDPAGWDLPPQPGDRPGRRWFRPTPRAHMPIDVSVGALATRMTIAGDRVIRMVLPLAEFRPGEYIDVLPVPDVLGRVRRRLVPNTPDIAVHDPRLVLYLRPGTPARTGAVLEPAWALDTRRREYGVLLVPAAE